MKVVVKLYKRKDKKRMKVCAWNIGMAATIPSNHGYKLLDWVIDEIVREQPDCIVLTEFVAARGIEHYFDVLEKNHYHWFLSTATKNNGILIALKSCSFNFEDTFDYNKFTVKNGNDVLKGKDLPNFYEIKVNWNNKPLSIIGVRIKCDITKTKEDYQTKQFEALDDYLSEQKHNVICVGDFNAFWADRWNKTSNTKLPKTAKNGYHIHTPRYNSNRIDGYSYIMPDGIKVQLDHLLTNIDQNITVEYDWGFLKHAGYNNVTAESVNKPKGMPDHAILKATID